jgi:hypothetical protein
MPLSCATIKRSQAIQLMTAKLKLKCLDTDRPTPSDTTLLTFIKLKNTGRLVATGVDKANDPWVQVPAQDDVTRLYLEAYTVSAFLCENDLVELPDEKPNHEREAYQKAKNAWYSSSLGDTASRHSHNDIKELFISHELLKAGYTISDELYVKYCLL